MAVVPSQGAQWIPTTEGDSQGVLDWIVDNVVKPVADQVFNPPPVAPPSPPFPVPVSFPTAVPVSFPTTVPIVAPQPTSPCIPPWRISPSTGRCELFVGPDVGPTSRRPVASPNGIHSADHAPMIVSRQTRSCGKGFVLGIDGVCHLKKMIPNSMRMYPKLPKPLGTRAELKAVRVAGSFGRRLAGNKKRIKKLATNLGKAC